MVSANLVISASALLVQNFSFFTLISSAKVFDSFYIHIHFKCSDVGQNAAMFFILIAERIALTEIPDSSEPSWSVLFLSTFFS